MTLKNHFLIAAILTMALVASCSKDTTSPTGTGGNADTTYYPMKVGYWWEYKGAFGSSVNRTSITKETTISGKSYFVQVSSSDTTIPQYFRYENNKVYSIGPNNPYGIVKDSEFVFLDFTAPLGTTNVYQGYSLGNTARKTVSLENKGVTYTAGNGSVYKDAIVYRIIMDVYLGGAWGNVSDNYYYYAKGVGLVGSKQSGVLTITDITNYSFK